VVEGKVTVERVKLTAEANWDGEHSITTVVLGLPYPLPWKAIRGEILSKLKTSKMFIY